MYTIIKRGLLFRTLTTTFLPVLLFDGPVVVATAESHPRDAIINLPPSRRNRQQRILPFQKEWNNNHTKKKNKRGQRRRRRVAVPPLPWFWNPLLSLKRSSSSELDRRTSSSTLTTYDPPYAYNPLRFYLKCMIIVGVWMTSGTLFYSYYNEWPIPQSFFYAVDAGMSIGFCTEVAETKLISKAFTIIYILLGASVIGGALALFIQDAMEGIAAPITQEYQVLLEKEVFEKANISRTGVLNYREFESLLRSSSDGVFSHEDIQLLWSKFDRLKDGVIHFEEFVGTYRGIEKLVKSLQKQNQMNFIHRIVLEIRSLAQQAWELEHRIYVVFAVWIAVGIIWGMLDQKWDPITSIHFAVSALATGGLTAPHVNADGILPAEPAIFCGVYCLFGIPLFALTLGHFARVLVASQVAAIESSAITSPLSPAEFDLAKHLTTRDSVVHLSDFIVLQLLRQGKLSMDTIQLMKHNFDLLDTDHSGVLTLKQATSSSSSLSSGVQTKHT